MKQHKICIGVVSKNPSVLNSLGPFFNTFKHFFRNFKIITCAIYICLKRWIVFFVLIECPGHLSSLKREGFRIAPFQYPGKDQMVNLKDFLRKLKFLLANSF